MRYRTRTGWCLEESSWGNCQGYQLLKSVEELQDTTGSNRDQTINDNAVIGSKENAG